MKTALGIIVCGSLTLNAQANEIHVMALSQPAGASGNLPATTYKPLAVFWVHEFTHRARGPIFQWAAGYINSPNQEATYSIPSSSPWGGESGRFQPSGTFLGGVRMQTPGILRFGIGLDLRASSEKSGGQSGDTGNSQTKIQFRPWLLGQVRYAPSFAKITPVVGIQYGISAADAPAPNKEFGFFAGLRF